MSMLDYAAMVFANDAHKGQVRKYTGEPYVTHCGEVVELLTQWASPSTEMIAAAWLHDTVEDCGVTLETISDKFGQKVAEMVEQLTDVSKPSDGNRAVRKHIDREHTAKACPEAKTIKLADLISNGRSIMERDPEFAKVYLAEKRLLLDEALQEGDPKLWALADQIVKLGAAHNGDSTL